MKAANGRMELPGTRALVDALFEPDQLMPIQFREIFSGAALPPEARLYREVVESALHDLACYPPGGVFYEDALAWVAGESSGAVSFVVAVESGYRGLDPDVLRAALLGRLVEHRFLRHDYITSRAAKRVGPSMRVRA